MNWILDVLNAHASDLAEIFGRALGVPLTVDFSPCSEQEMSLALARPGMHLRLVSQDRRLSLLIPEGKLLPQDYREPSPTSQAVIETLAQELSVALFPEDLEATATAQVCDDLRTAVFETTARTAAIRIRCLGEDGAVLAYVFSMADLSHSAAAPSAGTSETGEAGGISQSSAPPEQPRGTVSTGHHESERNSAGPPAKERRENRSIPAYLRALLRVPLAASVTLARRKQPVATILQLSPGTIIQFDKSCEELLDLEIAGRVIAQGEAVKVGDKFGLRILRMMPPPEQVEILRPKSEKLSPKTGSADSH